MKNILKDYLIVLHNNSTHTVSKLKSFKKRNKGYKEISAAYLSSLKSGAYYMNLNFNITIQEAWKLFLEQNRQCALTGQVLCFSNNKEGLRKQTASLDRIDSSNGYSINNVQWVHKTINKMKWSLSNKEFIELCNIVSDYGRKK